jgi:phosphoglycolate phosphatase
VAGAARIRVFFDIDGTLLYTDGAGRAALHSALKAVYGTAGPIDGYYFHGKTDPQIVVELMGGAGVSREEIGRRLPTMWPVYLEALERELAVRRAAGRITLLPGVTDLLAALEGREDVALGLLTGNIEEAARLKLAAAGITAVFEVGGFGSDSEDRSEIARIAVERSRGSGRPEVFVVVGDTPEDIACAHAVNARAVAVATGRHAVAELEQAGADAVFDDLRDTTAVLGSILAPAAELRALGSEVGDDGSR